jgi:hypothetical protein
LRNFRNYSHVSLHPNNNFKSHLIFEKIQEVLALLLIEGHA